MGSNPTLSAIWFHKGESAPTHHEILPRYFYPNCAGCLAAAQYLSLRRFSREELGFLLVRVDLERDLHRLFLSSCL